MATVGCLCIFSFSNLALFKIQNLNMVLLQG
jgi:hypothetical protein